MGFSRTMSALSSSVARRLVGGLAEGEGLLEEALLAVVVGEAEALAGLAHGLDAEHLRGHVPGRARRRQLGPPPGLARDLAQGGRRLLGADVAAHQAGLPGGDVDGHVVVVLDLHHLAAVAVGVQLGDALVAADAIDQMDGVVVDVQLGEIGGLDLGRRAADGLRGDGLLAFVGREENLPLRHDRQLELGQDDAAGEGGDAGLGRRCWVWRCPRST